MSFRVPIDLELPAVIVDDTPSPRQRVRIEHELPAIIKPRQRVRIEDSNDESEPEDKLDTELQEILSAAVEAHLPAVIDELVRGFGSVTSPPVSKATLRKRRQREREAQRKASAANPVFDEIPDWQMFINKDTLPQKGGFARGQIGRVVLKEISDNGLDENGTLNFSYDAVTQTYVISDNGHGIDPARVTHLFSVNRGLSSSKRQRHVPLRGMLGNGLRVVMGAVCAYDGTITITTRGHRLSLRVNKITGKTEVTNDDAVPEQPGTTVAIRLSVFTGLERHHIQRAIDASQGEVYTGPSRPAWHNVTDLGWLLRRDTTVAAVLADVFDIASDDDRPAPSLTEADVGKLHAELLQRKLPPVDLGYIGDDLYPYSHYIRISGTSSIEGREIPSVIECWADAERATSDGWVEIDSLLNRSPSLARLYGNSRSVLEILGCGLKFEVKGAKKAHYQIHLSLIAPYIPLTNDGKEPELSYFEAPMRTAVTKAAVSAYRAMVKPPKQKSLKEVACEVMEQAYMLVSDNNTLPANARQIMYAARPLILAIITLKQFDDAYFTQTLLPDFLNDHPDLCAGWDVVYDARGHFIEPHTRRSVALGTLQVREYLAERPALGPLKLKLQTRYPTIGPENRFKNILFVEKEGFDPLIRASRLYEKFDIAITSSKGMSNTALRQLIDGLVARGLERVFVLHDFDISGFSIAGTLTTSGRRYTYNKTVQMIDIGLRLDDINDEKLASESVTIPEKRDRDKIADTLKGHGATEEEIDYLLGRDDKGTKRVELNALTSRQFIHFVTRKLEEEGVEKLVPDEETLHKQARRLIEQRMLRDEIDRLQPEIARTVAEIELPDDLDDSVTALLAEQPTLSWDRAVARVIDSGAADDGDDGDDDDDDDVTDDEDENEE